MTEDEDQVSKIRTRKELVHTVDRLINESAIRLRENRRFPENISKVKSYLIESNSRIEDIEFSKLVRVEELDDKNLYGMTVKNQNQKKPIKLFADTTDARFWTVYSFDKSQESDSRISHIVNHSFNRLDYLWFSNEFLTRIREMGSLKEISASFHDEISEEREDISSPDYSLRIWGQSGSEVYNIIKEHPSFRNSSTLTGLEVRFSRDIEYNHGEREFYVDERVNFDGKISVKGTKAELHFDFLQQIKSSYQDLISQIESNQLHIESADGRLHLHGNSFEFEFSRTIQDYSRFVKSLLGSSSLRIAGVANRISRNHHIIPAIDLHNGDRVDIEVFGNKIFVNLWEGACGNTVLRMITNLQQVFDSSSHIAYPTTEVRR